MCCAWYKKILTMEVLGCDCISLLIRYISDDESPCSTCFGICKSFWTISITSICYLNYVRCILCKWCNNFYMFRHLSISRLVFYSILHDSTQLNYWINIVIACNVESNTYTTSGDMRMCPIIKAIIRGVEPKHPLTVKHICTMIPKNLI